MKRIPEDGKTITPVDENCRPSRKEKIIYSTGEIASNLSWNMVNAFLLYYYTDIANIPVAPLAWLFLCTKILDAFIDISAGALVDRTRSRWGHARPYLLFAAIPFGIMGSLVFMVPDISTQGKIIYAFVTYGLLGLCYSLVYVPYTALQPLISDNSRDHTIMGGLRSAGTSIASIIVYFSAQRLIDLTGGGAYGWGVTAVIFSLGAVALYFTVFAGTRERVPTQQESAPIKVVVWRMFRNPTWLSAFLLMLINYARVITLVSVLPYVAKILIGNTSMLGVFLTLNSIAVLVGGFFAGPLMNRYSVFSVNVAGVILSVAMFALLPLVEGNVVLMLSLFTVAALSISIFNSTAFAGCSNAANVQERLFGSRDEGMLASGISFGYKVGGAIGTAVVALLLSEAKYSPTEVTQAVTDTVRMCFYWLQIGLLVLHLPIIAMLRSSSSKVVSQPQNTH
ncbi:TPA: MFS transporter [Klebsiella pneumoniae]|nr:MFS transporter [Klebsiella pneumoniae]